MVRLVVKNSGEGYKIKKIFGPKVKFPYFVGCKFKVYVCFVRMSWNSVQLNISDYPNMAGLVQTSHFWLIRNVKCSTEQSSSSFLQNVHFRGEPKKLDLDLHICFQKFRQSSGFLGRPQTFGVTFHLIFKLNLILS